MKRDLDLIRAILKKVESHEDPSGLHETLDINGYNQNEISYHIKLLNDERFLDAMDVSSAGPNFLWWPGSLTWKGHELLKYSEDTSRWLQAKDWLLKNGRSFTLDLLLEWLKSQM